jgi:hypothetical protein
MGRCKGHYRLIIEAPSAKKVFVSPRPNLKREARDQVVVIDLETCRQPTVLLCNDVQELIPPDEIRPDETDHPVYGRRVDICGAAAPDSRLAGEVELV